MLLEPTRDPMPLSCCCRPSPFVTGTSPYIPKPGPKHANPGFVASLSDAGNPGLRVSATSRRCWSLVHCRPRPRRIQVRVPDECDERAQGQTEHGEDHSVPEWWESLFRDERK